MQNSSYRIHSFLSFFCIYSKFFFISISSLRNHLFVISSFFRKYNGKAERKSKILAVFSIAKKTIFHAERISDFYLQRMRATRSGTKKKRKGGNYLPNLWPKSNPSDINIGTSYIFHYERIQKSRRHVLKKRSPAFLYKYMTIVCLWKII